MVSAISPPPSSLTAAQPVSAMMRAAVRKACCGRFLVAAERQVDHDSACAEPRTTAAPCAIIISSVTGSVLSKP